MDAFLEQVARKVEERARITPEEGMALFRHPDLLGVGELARRAKALRSGDCAYFNVNFHINLTNVCAHGCRFCAFHKDKGQEGGYAMTVEDALAEARRVESLGVTEFHVVSACHPDLPFDYYLQVVRALKSRYPAVHIQAFTAVEIDYFASLAGLPTSEVLARLQAAGMGSLPGGGAEIFNPAVRGALCPDKTTGERWLAIHGEAHRLGMRTNATMLYGHLESLEDRVDHLDRLRRQQDSSGGFQAFIPLPFHPHNTRLSDLRRTSAVDDLRTIAVSRLMLDNIPHVKAFWIMLGLPVAQVSLQFGSDDLDGTVVEEKITHAAGATTDKGISQERLVALIREAGWTPVERDTLYRHLRAF